MSRPIAIFHHSRVSGGEPCIDFNHAIGIVAEQVIAMRESGLTAAASEIHFGVNGGESDAMAVAALAPDKAKIIVHPDGAKGEHPTLRAMQLWAKDHPGWYCYYAHGKGSTKPGDAFWAAWRRCLERTCVHNWRQCVAELDAGYESVSCHWLTPQQYPGSVLSPFWGGNLYWVTSDFFATLPLIEPTAKDRPAFYDAESLIGRGPRPPRVMDHGHHWPNPKDCSA